MQVIAAVGLACSLTALAACHGLLGADYPADARPPDPGDAGPPDDAASATGPVFHALESSANQRLVAVSATGTLVADQAAAGELAEFAIVDNPDGTVSLRARASDLYVGVGAGPEAALRAASPGIGDGEKFFMLDQHDGSFALRSLANQRFVSADLDLGAVLHANRPAVAGAWETFRFTRTTAPPASDPELGDHVLVFDTATPRALLQAQVDAVFAEQETNHFGPERRALLFKPGEYTVDVNVGFSTQVLGLGRSPDDVTIHGAVHAEADWFNGNATQNFWRAVENLAVAPPGGSTRWAVSQAAPFRRMHVRGSLFLDDGGWSSGGFIADSIIDGQIDSGTQQQWLSRNSEWASWVGANWNIVFVGAVNAPGGDWPAPPYTVIDETPVVREKPFLYLDGAGRFAVFVPALRSRSVGTTWAEGPAAGVSIGLDEFHIARAGADDATSLNAALDQGRHLLFTPGIYHLDAPLSVTRAGTVVLGLGLATLVPDGGVAAMTIADVDGVKVAGLLFDAGATSSPVLLEVGPPGASANHADNPTSLHDVFFRVGGASVGKAAVSLRIHSHDVIGDHFWIWRADHGDGVGWGTNTTQNGLVVEGDDVTIYGLFVEHYHQYQTLWKGERGRVYFYQSESPYDVPSQSSWMNGSVNGFASYKVASDVTTHEAWGMGIYCFFNTNPSVKLASAIEAPDRPSVRLHHIVTVSLGGKGEITHVVNGSGDAVHSGSGIAHLEQFP